MTAPPSPRRVVLLVTGSRSITDGALVHRFLDSVAGDLRPTVILHGGAAGVDTLAGLWAMRRGIAVEVHPPDFVAFPYRTHRGKAYLERDKAMVTKADKVVAIWDGESRGTAATLEEALRQGKLEKLQMAHVERPTQDPRGKKTRAKH